jgi:hypothetical protein
LGGGGGGGTLKTDLIGEKVKAIMHAVKEGKSVSVNVTENDLLDSFEIKWSQ